jgi:hypothetical protein
MTRYRIIPTAMGWQAQHWRIWWPSWSVIDSYPTQDQARIALLQHMYARGHDGRPIAGI